MTNEEIAELGWNARFQHTPWAEVAGYAREKALAAVADVVRTGTATSEMEHWFLRALRGEFSAPVVADKPKRAPEPVAVTVETPQSKRPTKKEK